MPADGREPEPCRFMDLDETKVSLRNDPLFWRFVAVVLLCVAWVAVAVIL